MRKVGQMLSLAIGRDEVIRVSRAQKVLRDWPLIVGDAMATRSFPDRYSNGTVWVAVEGSAWAQELRMQKEQILERLEEKCGKAGLFQNIRFGVRPLPEVREIVSTEKKVIPPPDPENRNLTIKEIAERRLRNWPDGGSSS